MGRITQGDLAPLNERLEASTPAEIIGWAADLFGSRLAILSAMQKAGTVVCHMAHAAGLKVDVLFVDTGVHFQETYDTRDRVAQEYGLNVVSLAPDESMAEQTSRLGVLYLSKDGQEQCCDLRKSQPLQRVRGRYDAFLASLRRGDGEKRAKVPILAVDPAMNLLRVNALANLSAADLDAYVREQQVIVNPLHSQGYTTIGCNRCTTPVLPDEPKRAGRWRHLGPWAMYCGINPTDLSGGTSQAISLPDELIDRLLNRNVDFAI
jgi:phosphoadenosine phosphosulfate reductase